MLRTATVALLTVIMLATNAHAYCTIQDQAAGTCPGQEGCTPLDYCSDYEVQGGSCCIYYGHPTSPTIVDQTVCGDDPTNNYRPTCIKANHYKLGLIKVTCTTVTTWYVLMDGTIETTVSTTCRLG